MTLDETLDDLVVANRILAHENVVDGFGHVSVRHPERPDRFFLSCSRSPALVTRDDILEFDLDCNPIDLRGKTMYSERPIHGGIFQARPDVNSVVHSHSPSVIPFGLVDTPMQAMFHNAAFLAGGVPVFDISRQFGATDMLVGNPARGVAFAQTVGRSNVALMRAHGSVACGPNLQLAVFRAVYTEVNARVQHWTVALGGGGKMAALDAEEGRLADVTNEGACMRAWELWRKQVRDAVEW